nr:hypothetical protein [Mycobacterium sp. E3298]
MDDWMFEAYKQAKATVTAFERMFELENENIKLKMQLKEHEDRVNRMFQASMKSVGDTLTAFADPIKD